MNAINYCPFGKEEEIVEAMTGLRDAVYSLCKAVHEECGIPEDAVVDGLCDMLAPYMRKEQYEHLQASVSLLMDPCRLWRKQISGVRKEGYGEAILAVKSMLSREFKPEGDTDGK